MYIADIDSRRPLKTILRSKCIVKISGEITPSCRPFAAVSATGDNVFSAARGWAMHCARGNNATVRPGVLRISVPTSPAEGAKASGSDAGTQRIAPAASIQAPEAFNLPAWPEAMDRAEKPQKSLEVESEASEYTAPNSEAPERTAEVGANAEAVQALAEPRKMPAATHARDGTGAPPTTACIEPPPCHSQPDRYAPGGEHPCDDARPPQDSIHNEPHAIGQGLLAYKKWWFMNNVDLSVGGTLISGQPISLRGDTLRMINDEYSYFVPLRYVEYIRTCDGLSILDKLRKKKT